MGNDDYQFDRWARRGRTDKERLRGLLRHRDPRFDSAKKFGRFIALVSAEWSRTPGINSWMGSFLEVAELGTIVDTSRRGIPDPSRPVYHVGWVRRLLHDATLALEIDGRNCPRLILQAWGQSDVCGRTDRTIADHHGIGVSTANDRVQTGRDAVYDELVRAGRAEPRAEKGGGSTRAVRSTA